MQFDPSLKMIADYEVNLFAHLNRFPFRKIRRTIAMCRDGGASTTRANFSTYIQETNAVRGKFIAGFFFKLLKFAFVGKSYLYYAIRYYRLQRPMGVKHKL